MLAANNGIAVGPPSYVPVGVAFTAVVRTIDDTTPAEQKADAALKAFLHPLTGGPRGAGWDFGEGLPASRVHALLESIPEIDYVDDLVLRTERGDFVDRVEIGANEMIATGEHEIRVSVAGGA
jgi:hypothetical protein